MVSRSDLAAIFHRLAHDLDALPETAAPMPPIPVPQMQSTVAPQQTGAASAPAPDPPVPPPAPVVPAQPKPVIDLDTVKGVQQALNQIRAANFPKLEENGVHDAVMIWDIKYFQASVGIPVTGAIDEITINTLHKAIFGTPRT